MVYTDLFSRNLKKCRNEKGLGWEKFWSIGKSPQETFMDCERNKIQKFPITPKGVFVDQIILF